MRSHTRRNRLAFLLSLGLTLPCSAARCGAALVTLLAGLALSPREGVGQTVTLPTIRTAGPRPEEAMLLRLLRETRNRYATDLLAATKAKESSNGIAADSLAQSSEDSAADSRARRVLHRLDWLHLASLNAADLKRVANASTETEQLRLLAGDRYESDDLVPQHTLAALNRFLDDFEPQRDCPNPPPETVDGEQDQLQVTEHPDSAKAQDFRRQKARLTCHFEEIELGRRDVARLFGGLSFEEAEAGRVDRVTLLDSLARVATAVVVMRRVRSDPWFPVGNRSEAEVFWRQRGLEPLGVGSISGSGKAGVAFTELASPILHLARVSINAVLAAEADEQREEDPATASPSDATIQRFLTGGGLFNVSFAVPVTKLEWAGGDVGFLTLLVPRFGLAAPVLGATSSDSATINADLGLELHWTAVDFTDGVGVLAQLRGGSAHGSKQFHKSLDVWDELGVQYLSASFGLVFGRQYLLTASRAVLGPRVLREAPWQIGLTVIRLPRGS